MTDEQEHEHDWKHDYVFDAPGLHRIIRITCYKCTICGVSKKIYGQG